MYLLTSWKDSLKIFLPQNFKVFFLVTLKSIGETYKVWLKNFWWLLLLYPVGFFVLTKFLLKADYMPLPTEFLGVFLWITRGVHGFTLLLGGIGTVLGYFMLLTVFLSARPSVLLKNFWYFWHYKTPIWRAFLWSLIFNIILTFLIALIAIGITTEIYAMIAGFICSFILLSVHFLFLLFLFDSEDWLISLAISRAIKMLLYNLPFFMITGMLVGGLFWGSFFGFMSMADVRIFTGGVLMQSTVFLTFLYLIWVIPICLINNFYIKRLREQFSLYYKIPGQ